MGADGRGPVGLVGVEGVEEGLLDSGKVSVIEPDPEIYPRHMAYFVTCPSRKSTALICERRSGSSVAGV